MTDMPSRAGVGERAQNGLWERLPELRPMGEQTQPREGKK